MRKLLTYCIFPLLIIGLAFLLYRSISEPMKFKKELQQRQNVAVEQLKDIRTLQVTYRDTYGHYATAMDSLVDFYNNGKITIMRQIGSEDDSVAVLHTEAVKKNHKNLKGEQLMNKLYELYEKGDNNLIIRLPQLTAVRDTLFNKRPDFKVEDLRYIPFAEGDTFQLQAFTSLTRSGTIMYVMECCAPDTSFLKGMGRNGDRLIVNRAQLADDMGNYPGLKIGDLNNWNNNAGNWE